MAATMLSTLLFASIITLASQAPQVPAPAQAAPTQALTVPPLVAPTREYVLPTAAETAALRSGIQFYERREYDKALEVFQRVSTEFPTSMMALYETALTYQARKEYQKAIDAAAKAAEFKNPELARVYALIGNVLDMNGEPKRAVDVYRKGIEFATEAAGTLYYNLAITYAQSLNDLPAAKAAAKQAALIDPTHASSQLYLAKLFLRDDLRTPGLFAAGRFLILEPASSRIQEAYSLWYGVIRGNMKPDGKGGTTVAINPAQSKDEGDMTQLDLHITLSRIAAMAEADKTEIQRMVFQVDALLGVISSTAAAKDKSTFMGSYYMPYFMEMQAKKFVEPFVYYISQRTPFPGVKEWLTANQERVNDFLSWSRGYEWPRAAAK
jgi:tetratricopeptide (TPR) repeat protein